jgi:hypothetical protein
MATVFAEALSSVIKNTLSKIPQFSKQLLKALAITTPL